MFLHTKVECTRPAAVVPCKKLARVGRLFFAPVHTGFHGRVLRSKRAAIQKFKAEGHNTSDGPDFHSLAKLTAGKLASELAGQHHVFERLQSWLKGDEQPNGNEDTGDGQSERSVINQAASTATDYFLGNKDKGGSRGGSSAGRIAGAAADYIGDKYFGNQSPKTDQAAQATDSSMLAQLSAEHLGLDTFIVDSVKNWLSNPSDAEERDDSQMVGMLVHRLLESFEHHTGEMFEGHEEQFDWLHNQAKSILGGCLTKGLLKQLVPAYLSLTHKKE